jgi:hypothetical protein
MAKKRSSGKAQTALVIEMAQVLVCRLDGNLIEKTDATITVTVGNKRH